MAKIPYIPLYIGDWEQDTNCLSLQAEAAWLKIIIKMHKDDKSGIYKASTKSLQKLFKSDTKELQEIIAELIENNIGTIEVDAAGLSYTFKNRRMLKEKKVSAARTKAVQNRYKSSTKTLQNADIDNEYDNDNELGKGGTEERGQQDPPDDGTFIVPKMFTVWKEAFPKYAYDQEKDWPALHDIAIQLCNYLNIPKAFGHLDETSANRKAFMSLWGDLVQHIRASNLYSRWQLTQVLKYLQSILQSFNTPEVPTKSAIQYLYERYCEEPKAIHKTVQLEHYEELNKAGLVQVDQRLIDATSKTRMKNLSMPANAEERKLHELYAKGEDCEELRQDALKIELHAKKTCVVAFFKRQKEAGAKDVLKVKK